MNAIYVLKKNIEIPYRTELKLNQRIKYEIEKNSDLLKGNIIAFKDNDFETPLLDQLYSEALDLLFPFFVFKDAYDAVQKSNESLTKQRIHLNNMKVNYFNEYNLFSAKLVAVKSLLKTRSSKTGNDFIEYMTAHICMKDLLGRADEKKVKHSVFAKTLDFQDYETSFFSIESSDGKKQLDPSKLTPFLISICFLLGKHLSNQEIAKLKDTISKREKLYFYPMELEYKEDGLVCISLPAKEAEMVKNLIYPYMLDYTPYWF